MESIIEELRREIYRELSSTKPKGCPNVCAAIRTPQGYASVERRVIEIVCADGITPSAAIGHVELEMEG